MTWIILVIIAILTMVAVSLIFASSTYGPMPGTPEDPKVLREDNLLIPEHDTKATEAFQKKHEDVKKLVPSVNVSYCDQRDLEATSQALLQAVECYEAIREEANSAVVELNLAILAKARLKVEQELDDDPDLIEDLKEYVDTATKWAGRLLDEEPKRYELDVKPCYDKLNTAQDARE